MGSKGPKKGDFGLSGLVARYGQNDPFSLNPCFGQTPQNHPFDHYGPLWPNRAKYRPKQGENPIFEPIWAQKAEKGPYLAIWAGGPIWSK